MTSNLIHLIGVSWGFIISMLFICLIVILNFWIKFQSNKIDSKSKSVRDNLIKNGEKVVVMYDELEIKTRSWNQEIEVGSGTNSRNEYVDVNNNHIYLKKLHRGHCFEQEIIIDMDPQILRMKLALKNELYLYFNPNNSDDYFLDIEFLFE
ncbi:hypothetical protein [Flavobacterium cheniae]|uniref:Uncharacterized protein n=1 Tax=Flavobacterium cheniae TaxID=295428 RepID=A0A562KCC8_9FLAO|nr:hypothetical protein [Flavobacterium cheniae]TDR18545.1 hypothetical protein C8D80_2429 [Flavobacterium cheniae]TWH92974.1 hypothetical protein IP97_02297 [Flavobacterium cheniae]